MPNTLFELIKRITQRESLVNEGLSLGVITRQGENISVSEAGIRERIKNAYGGRNDTTNRGTTFSQNWGLKPRS